MWDECLLSLECQGFSFALEREREMQFVLCETRINDPSCQHLLVCLSLLPINYPINLYEKMNFSVQTRELAMHQVVYWFSSISFVDVQSYSYYLGMFLFGWLMFHYSQSVLFKCKSR